MAYTIKQKAQMDREIHDATIGATATVRGGEWDNTMGCWVLIPVDGGLRYARTMKEARAILAP